MTADRPLRGGSWVNDPRLCRSAYRGHALPGNASLNSGFRVVCLPGEVTPPRMLLRGGSWDSDPRYCRSARRSHLQPDIAIGNIGLRVVCLPAAIAAELEGGND